MECERVGAAKRRRESASDPVHRQTEKSCCVRDALFSYCDSGGSCSTCCVVAALVVDTACSGLVLLVTLQVALCSLLRCRASVVSSLSVAVANQESESSSLPQAESVFVAVFIRVRLFDHIIRCHLSLPGIPRARFAKVAQFPCASNVPTASCQCAQTRETYSSTRIRREKNEKGGTSAARRVSSKARSGQMPRSASVDPTMVVDSPRTADGANGPERTRENQSADFLTHRLERIELLNDHRDELLLQCAESRRPPEGFLCRRTWLLEGDVASFQPFAAAKAQGKAHSEAAKGQKGPQMGQLFMSVFAVFVNGLVTENPGVTGLAEIEVEWLNQFRKQLISASDVGRCPEMWNIREIHSKGGPVRTLVRYRMRTPDPALPQRCAEDQQAGTFSAKSSSIEKGSNRKAQHHRRTTSEKYRVNSSIAARERRASTPEGRRD